MSTVIEIIISAVGLFLVVFCWGMVNVFTRKAIAMESAPIPLAADKPPGSDAAYVAELEADCAVPIEQVIREAEALAEVQATPVPAPVRPLWVDPRMARAVSQVGFDCRDCELDYPEVQEYR